MTDGEIGIQAAEALAGVTLKIPEMIDKLKEVIEPSLVGEAHMASLREAFEHLQRAGTIFGMIALHIDHKFPNNKPAAEPPRY